MERKGVSNEFIREVSKRINNLKKYSSLVNIDLSSELEQSMNQLSQISGKNKRILSPESCQANPPPEEYQVEPVSSHSTSFESSITNSDCEDEVKYQAAKVKGYRERTKVLKGRISQKMQALKRATMLYTAKQEQESREFGMLEHELEQLKGVVGEMIEEVSRPKESLIDFGESPISSQKEGHLYSHITELQQEVFLAKEKLNWSEKQLRNREDQNKELKYTIRKLESSISSLIYMRTENNSGVCKCNLF